MASTYTSSIGLEKPARNDYQNTWDVPVNANWDAIDGKLGGTLTIPLSNAEVDLTEAQSRAANIVFTGTISAAIAITFPAGFGGMFSVLNGTLGANPVSLSVLGASGAAVSLPQGIRTLVICDGTNVYLADQGLPPGTPLPRLSNIIPAGFILPYGQLISRVTYAGIFSVYGTTFGAGDGSTTFGMPDLRGKGFAGLDNMGGVAAGILTSFGSSGQTLGAVGGEQAHALIIAELAAHGHAVVDPAHNHGITDPGHNHNWGNTAQGGNSNATGSQGTFVEGAAPPGALNTTNSFTGITINNAATNISVSQTGSGTAHNNIQPTMLCNWIIKT